MSEYETPAALTPKMIEVPTWDSEGRAVVETSAEVAPSVPETEASAETNTHPTYNVLRNPTEEGGQKWLDSGWSLIANIDKNVSVNNGRVQFVPGVRMEKVDDQGNTLTKEIKFTDLLSVNPEAREELLADKVKSDLGTTSMKALGVQEPIAEVAPAVEAADPALDILNQFGVDDRIYLKSYAEALKDQKDIHKAAQRGEDVMPGASQDAAQSAQWALNKLSPQARAVAGRFASVYPPRR